MMHYSQLIPVLFSFLFTLLCVKLMLRWFPKWKLLDRPHEYDLTRSPIPYSGGVIFFIVFLIAALFWVPLTPSIIGVLAAGFLITAVSFIDDRVRLSPWIRLFVQILAGAIVVFAGLKIQIISNPFNVASPFYLDAGTITIFGQTIWILSALFIIAWLVLMMNVMNWLDGIPGLTSGISVIAQVSIFILASRQFNIVDQSAVIMLSGVLAASALAFLFFDFTPPKILMGDTGSMFLGFMLGALSILAGGKLATALLIMGFPVVDAIWVIFKRIARGKSPLHGDYSHFHHRLLRVGLSERKALIFNYLFCGMFAAIALILSSTAAKAIAFVGILILMAVLGSI